MIHATGLTVRIRRSLALDGIDLVLGTGVHAVLGVNGSGKSTLLRTLATALAPTEGTVRLLDRDPDTTPALLEIRRRLGYLPQEFGLYRNWTVREFLCYAAWLKEMPTRRLSAAVEEAASRMGLMDRIDVRIRSLSGGMRQRVGIAQAVVNSPELLILDEPTAGLDYEHRSRFAELLREVAEEACVVVSTHQPEDVEQACSSATVLRRGKVAFHGTFAEMAAAGGNAGGAARRLNSAPPDAAVHQPGEANDAGY